MDETEPPVRNSQERLKPATLEHDGGRPPYRPRLPWKWIFLGLSAVAILGGTHYVREESKASALRGEITSAYDLHLAEAAARVRAFRGKLEGWTVEAAAHKPETFVDNRLNLAGLHKARGVYLRIPAEAAKSPETIEEAASKMTVDAITKCLGVTPTPLRGLYQNGRILMPGWIEEARDSGSVMRLRVMDEELARHVRNDLPPILTLLQADYFLLILEQGENRIGAAVDAFMWDLREDQLLLAARVEADGVLIPARIGMKGAPRTASAAMLAGSGAADCSIAAHIKELTGRPAIQVESGVDRVDPPDE